LHKFNAVPTGPLQGVRHPIVVFGCLASIVPCNGGSGPYARSDVEKSYSVVELFIMVLQNKVNYSNCKLGGQT
jgi:hypothetical protein